MERFNRVKKLVGDEVFKQLQQTKIIIFGVGGVGSYALDCLYRTGFQNITIVDFDKFDITNQNRQIGSDFGIDQFKVDVLKQLYPKIKTLNLKVTPEFIYNFDFKSFDFVIDAIDDISAKVALAEKTWDKLISSMGSAQQIDCSKIMIKSIWKTEYDPLAKVFRKKLREKGFKKDFPTVFSSAERLNKSNGSFVGVTGSFGLMICSFILNKMVSRERLELSTSGL